VHRGSFVAVDPCHAVIPSKPVILRRAGSKERVASHKLVILSREAAKERFPPRDCLPMPYHVYIMSSESFALYIGITRHLPERVHQHRAAHDSRAFTARRQAFKLVHFETTNDVMAAIAREKQLKGWRRARKIALIAQANPDWRDLAERPVDEEDSSAPSLRSG
jgi:putative endonuclease